MYIVTAKEMYDIDRYTIEEIGLAGSFLMENAGREIFKRIIKVTDSEDSFIVLVGAGNNGGDGFVIARYLLNDGRDVDVVQVVPDEKIIGDAKIHKDIFLKSGGVVIQSFAVKKKTIQAADCVIDALLGIGIKGDLLSPYKEVVAAVNDSESLVISVDTPSGLPIDLIEGDFTAIEADYTFMVGAAKMSAFLVETSHYYGEWDVVDIGFSDKTIRKYTNRVTYGLDDFIKTMPRRSIYAHKGDHGKGLLIGGSSEMPGAITMATKAALVAGSGLVTTATLETIIPIIANHIPEGMMKRVRSIEGQLVQDDQLLVQGYHAIAIGVGMGRHLATGEFVLDILEKAPCPVIIDADGLFHLVNRLDVLNQRQSETILTPHTGEMARLLGIPVGKLLQDPFTYTLEFARKHNVYVLLKGKQTIITAPDGRQAVESSGNPGLAKGGSGDVLTGIILAQVLQTDDLFSAICNACFIHGTAADQAVAQEKTVYDLVATDVIRYIGEVYRMISD